MSETKTVWRECADPEELAAAVAAGVKVQYEHDGRWHRNYFVTADEFAAYGLRYRVPASWSWPPEPPAPDDLVSRARRHADTHPESMDLIEELLGAVAVSAHLMRRERAEAERLQGLATNLNECLDLAIAESERLRTEATATPVPPWPGAVLSGCVDEDGEPTWLARAGNVQGESVRTCADFPWFVCGSDNASDRTWVEVRAPRAVPETGDTGFQAELVNLFRWECGDDVDADHLAALVIAIVGEYQDHPGFPVAAPDGTVEVRKDGDR